MSRRDFLRTTLQGTAAAACLGTGWYATVIQQAKAAPHPLRPPGALDEREFSAACIKCGRCVVACPYRTLKLADLGGPGPVGLPWFEPRSVACAMCPDLPCVSACPTGALATTLTDVTRARMGLAVIDAEQCLSWQGLRCEVCYRVCPVRGTAIRIDPHPRRVSRHAVFVPVVSAQACTGCGLCENACPTEVAAIHVVNASLVQGRIGSHYRLSSPNSDESAASAPIAAPPEPTSAVPQREVPLPPVSSVPGVDYLNRKEPP